MGHCMTFYHQIPRRTPRAKPWGIACAMGTPWPIPWTTSWANPWVMPWTVMGYAMERHGLCHGLRHGLYRGLCHELTHGLCHGLWHGLCRGLIHGLRHGLCQGLCHGLHYWLMGADPREGSGFQHFPSRFPLRVYLLRVPCFWFLYVWKGSYSGDGVAVVVASLQRALHACMGQKNVEISITFSDPYQKCVRKPWKFIFLLFFSSRPLY